MRPSIRERLEALLKPMPGRTSRQLARITGHSHSSIATHLIAGVKAGWLTRKRNDDGHWTYYLTGEER